MNNPTTTPWGESQWTERIADGICFVSTASHGGYGVFGEAASQLSREAKLFAIRQGDTLFYEEDCAWAILATELPEHFSDARKELAEDLLKRYYAEYLALKPPRTNSGEQIETGPFRLRDHVPLKAHVALVDDPVHDAEMVANLFEEAQLAGLIETPTVNGADVNLRVSIAKGFGHSKGEDSCLVLMYCEEWEHLAGDTMPIGDDFPTMVRDRAGTRSGPELARAILLTILEYAFIAYRHLGPYMAEEDRELAGIAT